MKKNLKLFIIVILVIIAMSINYKPQKQIVAPSCFLDEDCEVPVQEGYCDVSYGCYQGNCFSKQILCDEDCSNGEDDDFDSLVDCADPDCYVSPKCPCERASFNTCKAGSCYCPPGSLPTWSITEVDSWCGCI